MSARFEADDIGTILCTCAGWKNVESYRDTLAIIHIHYIYMVAAGFKRSHVRTSNTPVVVTLSMTKK